MRSLLFSLVLLFFNTTLFAQGFTVKNFSSDIYLSSEGYFDVVEKYDIEFTEPKHGIFRDIITKYDFKDESGKTTKREIYISDIEVPLQKFKTNQYFGKSMGGNLRIRIGDKNVSVTGRRQYEIRYRVRNALISANGQVQLYWNLKPSGWLAVFDKGNFTVHAPEGAVLSNLNCFLYSGSPGESEPSKGFTYRYDGNIFSAQSTDVFLSLPGQSTTVLIKMPEKLFKETAYTPGYWQRFGWVGIIILIWLINHIILLIYGKPKKVKPITSYYPPNGMDPAMAGILIDDNANYRDILSLLPWWGTKGIIKMEAIPVSDSSPYGNLRLIKLKDLGADAADYELSLFKKIFKDSTNSVLVSNLQNVVFNSRELLIKKFKAFFYKPKVPAKRRWGCLVGLWAIGGTILFWMYWGWLAGIANFIACLLISIVALLREKNNEGNEAFAELLGFKNFIKMAEAGRIKELLKDDPTYFEKTMPYAVAFNMLKEWTAKFEGLTLPSLDWYKSSSGSHFAMNSFASSFNGSMKRAEMTMVSVPSSVSSPGGSSRSSSSGGGHSGGGFGGGGGGSW